MKKLLLLALIGSALMADWVMYGENQVFMFNPKTGEVYRYFEQDGVSGFMKLNYHKNFTLKSSKTNATTPASTNATTVDKIGADLLKDTLLKNSLNGILE